MRGSGLQWIADASSQGGPRTREICAADHTASRSANQGKPLLTSAIKRSRSRVGLRSPACAREMMRLATVSLASRFFSAIVSSLHTSSNAIDIAVMACCSKAADLFMNGMIVAKTHTPVTVTFKF